MPAHRKSTIKEKAANLIKTYKKNGSSQTKTAKALGISQSAVNQQLRQPAAQELLHKVIDDSLRKAGITTDRIYGQLSRQLDAKSVTLNFNKSDKTKKVKGKEVIPVFEVVEAQDWNAQDKARESALELMRHKKNKVEIGVDTELADMLKQSNTSNLKALLSKLKT